MDQFYSYQLSAISYQLGSCFGEQICDRSEENKTVKL